MRTQYESYGFDFGIPVVVKEHDGNSVFLTEGFGEFLPIFGGDFLVGDLNLFENGDEAFDANVAAHSLEFVSKARGFGVVLRLDGDDEDFQNVGGHRFIDIDQFIEKDALVVVERMHRSQHLFIEMKGFVEALLFALSTVHSFYFRRLLDSGFRA